MEAAKRMLPVISSISLDADVSIPLVVDLNKTLNSTDTLHESLAKLLFSDPVAAFSALLSILQGRAAFKARIAEQVALDGELFALSHFVARSTAARKGARTVHSPDHRRPPEDSGRCCCAS